MPRTSSLPHSTSTGNLQGTDLTEERSGLALLLTNVIFIIGILVFAVLLGMVGEEVGGGVASIVAMSSSWA